MKWKRFISGLFSLVIFIIFLFPGCKDSETINPNASGILVQYEGCKPIGKSLAGYEVAVTGNEDCIEYSYNGQTLFLKHVNSAFNCCPGVIGAVIDVNGNTITIGENEQEAGCLCLCLFDLDYEISNLESGEYTIIIHQLYLEENDQILELTLQLLPGTSGTFCVPRNHYPWNI